MNKDKNKKFYLRIVVQTPKTKFEVDTRKGKCPFIMEKTWVALDAAWLECLMETAERKNK